MQEESPVIDVVGDSISNDDFRRVIRTGRHMQLVFMSLKPKEIIDMEVHQTRDQWIEIRSGFATVTLGKHEGEEHILEKGQGIFIPAGTWHQVENNSFRNRLSLSTIYSPPEHPSYTIEHDKPVVESIVPSLY